MSDADGKYDFLVDCAASGPPVVSVEVAGIKTTPSDGGSGAWRWAVALIVFVLILAAIRQCRSGCRWCRSETEGSSVSSEDVSEIT